MIRNANFAVVFVTCYLFLYCALLQYEITLPIGLAMVIPAPLLVIWMVYTVLKYGKYDGPELGAEEFGYQDKKKDELGVF